MWVASVSQTPGRIQKVEPPILDDGVGYRTLRQIYVLDPSRCLGLCEPKGPGRFECSALPAACYMLAQLYMGG